MCALICTSAVGAKRRVNSFQSLTYRTEGRFHTTAGHTGGKTLPDASRHT